MVQIIGWVVLAPAVSWAICTNFALRQHYKHSDQPELPAIATALTQLTGIVAVAGCSPFHLLWLFPASYFTGFLALRSRIISAASRGFTAMSSPTRSHRTGKRGQQHGGFDDNRHQWRKREELFRIDSKILAQERAT